MFEMSWAHQIKSRCGPDQAKKLVPGFREPVGSDRVSVMCPISVAEACARTADLRTSCKRRSPFAFAQAMPIPAHKILILGPVASLVVAFETAPICGEYDIGMRASTNAQEPF